MCILEGNMHYPKVRILGIPSFRQMENKHSGKSYFTYQLEVLIDNEIKLVERRYSEFLSLHKKIHKLLQSHLDFPPKKMLNKDQKVLNARRIGLESYFQMLLNGFQDCLPTEVYQFLGIKLGEDCFSRNQVDDGAAPVRRPACSHQPVVTFQRNSYLQQTPEDCLNEEIMPDSLAAGLLCGMYENGL